MNVAGKIFGFFTLAALLSGCISVDYVGQSFPARPDDAPVTVYKENVEYPAGEYRVIGRATLSANDDFSPVDMYEKILTVARENGADAVKVVSAKQELLSSVYRQETTTREPNYSLNSQRGYTTDGDSINYDSFGQRVVGKGKEIKTYEMVLKALLLVTDKRFNEEMSKRDPRFVPNDGKIDPLKK